MGAIGVRCALWLAFCVSSIAAQEPVRLIGHRGGVVDGKRPENSAAALEEAIRRGYWMVETDVDESKDGHLVVHHGSFWWSFREWRSPGRLTWDQIRQLRAKEDGSRPLEFGEYVARCKNRVHLMIDTKGSSHSPRFYASMERTLRENGLLENTYFIGLPEARRYFKGKGRVSIGVPALERAVAAREPVSRLYFLFGHGNELNRKALELARRAGVPVVASVNDYHYSFYLRSHTQAAREDIARLRRLGFTQFQFDSAFEPFLR